MPQRTASRASKPRHFALRDRVFHLVNAADFERSTRRVPTDRAEAAAGVSSEVQANTLRAGSRTACCNKPVTDVYAVAIDKKFVSDVRWCEGAK